MKNISKLILLCLLTIVFCHLAYANNNSKKAEAILIKAHSNDFNINYKYKVNINKKSSFTVSNFVGPDGSRYNRFDSKSPHLEAFILNIPSGTFYSINKKNILIKDEYSGKRTLKKVISELKSNNPHYSLKRVKFNGEDCFYIIREIKVTKHITQELKEKLLKKYGDGVANQDLSTSINKIEEFYIGVNDNFFRGQKLYDRFGKLKSSMIRENIEFNPKISQKDFMIPKNTTIKVAKTQKDFVKLYK
jgi:hypothetical protein